MIEKNGHVVIIGAGVSGLATARALTARGVQYTIYDRSKSLGGVWADGYAGFGVQVERSLYEFPEFPLPEAAPSFTPGPVFQDYLESYCDAFGLRDRLVLGATVQSVRPSGAGWDVVVSRDGAEETVAATYVVVATGLYSGRSSMPDIPGAEDFSGEILHSSDVKDFNRLRGKRVAVVGYGKSATDIAAGAVDVADKVHLVFKTAHWPVPRKLLGLLPFKWGMLTRLVAGLIPPYVRPTPIVRAVHTIGYPLPWLFWRIVEVLLRIQQRLATPIAKGQNLVPAHPVEYDAYTERTMVPRPGFIGLIHAGKIQAHRTGLERYGRGHLQLCDGTALDVDCVVYGTGWVNGYEFLPSEVRAALGEDRDGFYLYRHILHPDVPGLAFVGKASSFMSVSTYALQARWLAEILTNTIERPSNAEMTRAIEQQKAWKRSWMPPGPARSSTLLLHMSQYHDELLLDMGEDPLRKRGLFFAPLKEIVFPYVATDYRDVVA